MKKILFLSFLMVFVGCSSLSDKARKVRIADSIEGCEFLGTVEVNFWASDGWIDLKIGGNYATVTNYRDGGIMGPQPNLAEAYLCAGEMKKAIPRQIIDLNINQK